MDRMDWKSLLFKARFSNPVEPFDELARTGFQRDFDRIVFSNSFRRLQGKTQVHPLPENDHIHNRLTHSIEVASVGRSLGIRTGMLLEGRGELPSGIQATDIGAIVQAACIAHDIGNPPFGHAFEEAISQCLRGWLRGNEVRFAGKLSDDQAEDLSFFDGNAQGFRIMTRIEHHFEDGGMRLSYPTLATFLKYPWTKKTSPAAKKNKASAFLSELPFLRQVCNTVGLIEVEKNRWCRHPLAYLVEAADDICYKIIDVEDGIEMGLLDFNDYKEVLAGVGTDAKSFERNPSPGQARSMFFSIRGDLFDRLINEVMKSFEANYDRILAGQFEGDLISASSDPIASALAHASELCKRRVFTDRRKTIIEIGVGKNLEATMLLFCNAVADYILYGHDSPLLSAASRKVIDHVRGEGFDMPSDLYSCVRGVLDYIAGMTDKYASHVARHVNGIIE